MSIEEKYSFHIEKMSEDTSELISLLLASMWNVDVSWQHNAGQLVLTIRASTDADIDGVQVEAHFNGETWSIGPNATGIVNRGTVIPAANDAILDHVLAKIPALALPAKYATDDRSSHVDFRDDIEDGDSDGLAFLLDSEPFEMCTYALLGGSRFTTCLTPGAEGPRFNLSAVLPEGRRAFAAEHLGLEAPRIEYNWLITEEDWLLDLTRTGVCLRSDSKHIAWPSVGGERLGTVLRDIAPEYLAPTTGSYAGWHSLHAPLPESTTAATAMPSEAPSAAEIVERKAAIAEFASRHDFPEPIEVGTGAFAERLQRTNRPQAGWYILQFTNGHAYVGESITLSLDPPTKCGVDRC